jgi:hypothetical protein
MPTLGSTGWAGSLKNFFRAESFDFEAHFLEMPLKPYFFGDVTQKNVKKLLEELSL